jgi:UDPglucose 6-dehydrogenase
MSLPRPTAESVVSVVGLGKLGACLAAALAMRGRTVIGVDVQADVVDALNRGDPPHFEPHLREALAASRARLSATTRVDEAVRASTATFVVVPTPSEPGGAFSLDLVRPAFASLGRALRRKDDWHLVVLMSTVLPGMTRQVLVPVLEEWSGKRCGVDFGVCYSPAFIALGSVIRDFLNPDFVLVGESDARAGEALESLYASVLENGAPVRRMSLENAELAKIGVNTFVTTKIAFANMIADLCERVPGGDVDVVTGALGLDRRIGRPYLTGGLGYGGPCFPRDNRALSYLAQALGTSAPLAEATDRANQSLPDRVVARLSDVTERGAGVALLGLAYKPGTHVTDGSQGLLLAEALCVAGARVRAYDPLAAEQARRDLPAAVTVTDTLEEAVEDAEVVLVCTPDPAFRNTTAAALSRAGRVVTVLDFWRMLEPELADQPAVRYLPVGRCLDVAGAAERLAKLWGDRSRGGGPETARRGGEKVASAHSRRAASPQ